MSTNRPDGLAFTFVDYDINRTGVTNIARAHLMKHRARSKREARSEWISRNQFSPLRWMRPKQKHGEASPAAMNDSLQHTSESTAMLKKPMLRYTAVIDFQKDNVTSVPLTKKPRSVSSQTGASRERPEIQDHEGQVALSERDSSSNDADSSPDESRGRLSPSRSEQQELTSGVAATIDSEREESRPDPEQPRGSPNGGSEFKLSMIEGLRITTLLQEPWEPHWTSDFDEESPNEICSELRSLVERTSIPLMPPDRRLIRYFAFNAGVMFGFDKYQAIVEKYDPVLTLFVPFALASQWCFETMVLLFSAYHRRDRASWLDTELPDAEKQYLASRQNGILATTRSRISALANARDSADEDVVAFLFLAVAEYCSGNREIGVMHFKAWREYCEMRRELGIPPCGLPCKTVVWWCVSILVEDDVLLHTILSPATKAKIQEEPERLLKYFVTYAERVELKSKPMGNLDLAQGRY
ncbi:hypothetical protein LTR98_009941 [Exophiala xenobiotica]|nr:hypothetical protein LTR98_009941 [Exophiala xenobiotica]